MKFNPAWHELFEKLGGMKHLAEFMPAKLKDNETVALMIGIAGEEVADFCETEEKADELIEVVDMIMCVAYVAGYKASQADQAAEKEFPKP